jgi:hypothetical protein
VGRQGNFPHGIVINTTADYFSLGNISHAYCKVAPFIAGFPEYTRELLGVLLRLWFCVVGALFSRHVHTHTHTHTHTLHVAFVLAHVTLVLAASSPSTGTPASAPSRLSL